jgi:hypothetical protein
MGENPKANPGRQPCRENKEGDNPRLSGNPQFFRLAGFQQVGYLEALAIPGDKETTLKRKQEGMGGQT